MIVSLRPDGNDSTELYMGHFSSATRQQKAAACIALNLMTESAPMGMRADALEVFLEEQVKT